VLLSTAQHQPDRRAGLAREIGRQHAEIPDAVLGAESAAGEVADDPDLALGQAQHFGRFVSHAGGELGGGVERETLLAPVGHDAVSLHRHVGLYLGAILALDHDVGLRQSLLYVAAGSAEAAAFIRTADIALLWKPWRRTSASGGGRLLGWPGIDQRRVRLHGRVEQRDVGQRLVFNLHQLCGRLRRARGLRRHCRDRLAGIADHRIALTRFRLGIA
jgi:hypothetical protein